MTTLTNPAPATRLTFATTLFAAFAAVAHAQAYTPPPPNLTTAPCVPTKTEPCASRPAKAPGVATPSGNFPFPGESPDSTAPAFSAPSTPDQTPVPPPNLPPAGSTPSAQPPADSKFPFPGESPDNASSPGSSSSSSSSSSDAGDAPAADTAPDASGDEKSALKDAGSSGSTRFSRRKIVAPEDLDHRELEDLNVSKYYMTTGNYLAAYKRAQDAMKLYPEDENAHIALAVAADKLDKKPEAIAEYHAYLAVAPDGERAKFARHALEILEPGDSVRK